MQADRADIRAAREDRWQTWPHSIRKGQRGRSTGNHTAVWRVSVSLNFRDSEVYSLLM